AFITKLNHDGDALVYSTYFGSDDYSSGIAVDRAGNAYITGYTSSTKFPTQNPLQATFGGIQDAFVTKLNHDGDALVYSTYLGGSFDDSGSGIAVDRAGNAYITGNTNSTNFPTQNPLPAAIRGIQDAFVTKLNHDGDALVYSTYLGGSNNDYGYSIAVDRVGNAYITGSTFSTNFPTRNPLQPAIGGDGDAFITKLNPDGNALVYSTYLGGNIYDYGSGIFVDRAGNAYITGYTSSTNFPTQNPLQAANGGNFVTPDAFVSKLTDSNDNEE
ncbi:MAG: SBBP repeat-containing protein, partial [Rhizonema sp. NSF051]|nr:SBBP repeat-containing protein [Rhizonema sp. NSF051]